MVKMIYEVIVNQTDDTFKSANIQISAIGHSIIVTERSKTFICVCADAGLL